VWRPCGTPEQELGAFFLGRVPALLSHEPLYETAWKDRSQLVTVATGLVTVDLCVVTRFLRGHGVDGGKRGP